MSDIPSFPYKLLWQERGVRSVANLTVADGHGFFEQISISPVQTRTELFPLAEADLALQALREGKIHGAAVLYME